MDRILEGFASHPLDEEHEETTIASRRNRTPAKHWINRELNREGWGRGRRVRCKALFSRPFPSFPSFFPIFLRFLLTVRPLFIADRAESLESAPVGTRRLMSCDECPRSTRSPLSPSPSFSLPVSSLHGRFSPSLSSSSFHSPPFRQRHRFLLFRSKFSDPPSLDSASSSLSLYSIFFFFFSFPFFPDSFSIIDLQ